MTNPAIILLVALLYFPWESKYVKVKSDGSLQYIPDEKGNIIPDFSRVGYYGGDQSIPDIPVVKTISPGSSEADIQAAINEVAAKPVSNNGYRGAILLKKGSYTIPNGLRVEAGGIVLRGEGDDANGTKLVATTKIQGALIKVTGKGRIQEIKNTRTTVTDGYVPAGAFSFNVADVAPFKKGDHIIVFRPGTDKWVKDLQMDRIVERPGTKQWRAKEYDLEFERVITKIEGKTIFIDNPIVMPMETQYGGAQIFKYQFDGRISHVGIENLYCESEFEKDTSENHAWDAINMDRIEQSWVRNVTARYFAFSSVNLGGFAKNITVENSNCYDHKSVITGGRRYSFCNTGQLNLFINCKATDGRHDFVTGARTLGPNVFYNCTAGTTHADIGPHHRWSVGTLYDNITTDGEINIQDRGNWGSGHGWAGVTQVLWNCKGDKVAVQNPWVSGKNYCIGLKGHKVEGRLKGRPDGEWEGLNEDGLKPASLYMAQLKQRQKTK